MYIVHEQCSNSMFINAVMLGMMKMQLVATVKKAKKSDEKGDDEDEVGGSGDVYKQCSGSQGTPSVLRLFFLLGCAFLSPSVMMMMTTMMMTKTIMMTKMMTMITILIPGSSLQEGGETEEDDLWTTWGKVRTMVMKMAMVIVVMTIMSIMTITMLTTMKILLEDDL